MTTEAEFFLGSKSSVVQLDTIEITHPSFSKTYRLVRNAVNGLTATLETDATVSFDYYPMKFTKASLADDLDFAIQIDFGDLGEIIPDELDRVSVADSYGVYPSVIYRTYRSDDLTEPLVGPLRLRVESFSTNGSGCSFNAKAPSLNVIKTGESYDIDRFSGLRGFL